MRRLAAVVAAIAVTGTIGGSHATTGARAEGAGSGLKLVANVPYAGGTDLELATIRGRDYAFAGDGANVAPDPGALRVIDVTRPAAPRVVAKLGCALYQADIQISHDRRTLIMAADTTGGPDACLMFGRTGFMTVDITDPRRPRPVGIAQIPRGSHNVTAHPAKPYVYNSDSDLTRPGEIQIWSIRNPARPRLVNTVESLPHSPHDISFSSDGRLAVTAAQSHFDIFDTSDPVNPRLVYSGQCPGCSITHDAKFTPDGRYLVIGDELGGGTTVPCPGGALYFYRMEGVVPVLVGVYEPGEIGTARGEIGACTSHVFDISDDSKRLAISWYRAGTRYLDISDPTGATLGTTGAGVRELGWFIPDDGESWASKFHEGPYIYSNDIRRGFDVYRITRRR